MTQTTVACAAATHDTLYAYRTHRCRCPQARELMRIRQRSYESQRVRAIRLDRMAAMIKPGVPGFYARPERGCARLKHPDVMFPQSPEEVPRAQAVCAPCRFKDECATWAIRTGQAFGVWGGLAPAELRRLVVVRRQQQAGCGHVWPAELTSDAECLNCGLPYGDWSEGGQ